MDLDIPINKKDDLSLLEQSITDLLKEQGNMTKKRIIYTLSSSNDFTEEKISSAIINLKNLGVINYSRKKPQGYYLVSQEITQIEKSKRIQEKSISESVSATKEIVLIFIDALSKEGTVGSKLKLEKLMIGSGLTTEEFLTVFKSLKEQNIIKYSRSAPRGYSVQGSAAVEKQTEIIIQKKDTKSSVKKLREKPITVPLKISVNRKTTAINQDIKEKFIRLIQTNPPISSKLKLIEFMVTQGIEKKKN